MKYSLRKFHILCIRLVIKLTKKLLIFINNFTGQEIFSSLSLNYLRKRKSIFQKLLFSATLSQDPEKLKRLNLFQPILFTSTDKNKEASEVNNGNHDRFIIFISRYVL